MRALPEGTVTFLFTDIEGSTRLLQEIGGEAYARLLIRHHELIRGIVGAAEVSTEGDSFFCAFDTPAAAVVAAAEIQRLLSFEDWGVGGQIRVRMGIHTGEGVLRGDGYVGLDVHRASRISSAAHGGQILISDSTRALVSHDLPAGLGLSDLGEHQLKDLSQPERLYQVTIQGLETEFPPPATPGGPGAVLPEYLTSFVGRSDELKTIVDSIGRARMVTLTGIGGAGKTRLAVEAARSIEDFGDGVSFVALENAADQSDVDTAVAESLGLSEQIGQPVETTITKGLAAANLLLILDNCEQVTEGAARLAEAVLTRCPSVKILATSREPLRIAGEQIVRVGSMQLPKDDVSDEVLESDAVKLFTDRAGLVNIEFEPSRWGPECVQICSRLEGIPLAIELAAARTDIMTPPEILARLADRFDILASRSRRRDERHSTLAAAIDWSYELLEEDSQRLLRSLAVFKGGFTPESVAAVHYEGSINESAVLERLIDLGDKSLLSRDLEAPGVRFRQLDTVGEFALLRLREAGDRETVVGRHRNYFAGLAEREARRLGGADQLAALQILETEHDNLLVAIRRAAESGATDAAADLAGRLSWFWYLHGHFSDGERWAGALLDSLPDEPGRPWLRLLVGAAQYDFRIGAYDRARERLTSALALARSRGSRRMEMWSHAYMATTDLYEMRIDEAAESARKAEAIAGEIGDFVGHAYATYIALSAESGSLRLRGLLDSAGAESFRDRLAPLVEAVKASGERNMIGHVLETEGLLAVHAGRLSDAVEAFGTAVEALTELGQVGCACHCLDAIAELAAMNDKSSEAIALVAASDHLRSRIGITVAPVEQTLRGTAVSTAASALSPEERIREENRGARLSLSEASQLARQTLAAL